MIYEYDINNVIIIMVYQCNYRENVYHIVLLICIEL